MLSKSSARISNPRSSFCAKTVLKCSTSKTETRESSGDRKRIFWIRTETSWKSMRVRERNRVEAVGKYNYSTSRRMDLRKDSFLGREMTAKPASTRLGVVSDGASLTARRGPFRTPGGALD